MRRCVYTCMFVFMYVLCIYIYLCIVCVCVHVCMLCRPIVPDTHPYLRGLTRLVRKRIK